VSDRYRSLIAEIEQELPGFRVVRKDQSSFQRLIDRALRIVTFGAQREYLTSYQTTIGKTVYVTSDWDDRDPDDRWATMRHELMHLRQFRRYTLPGMAFLYLLVPLPLGLAWFRARFEKEGYAETIRANAEIYGFDHVKSGWFRDMVIEQFTSGAYGWMWPFRRSMERWYDGVLAALSRERA
jgi:hypothetical protein